MYTLSTLVLQDLHLICAALMSSQRAKQLLSADVLLSSRNHQVNNFSYMMVLQINFH